MSIPNLVTLKKIKHDILPNCSVAVKVISNLFSHTDSSCSGGLKLSWEEPGLFWNLEKKITTLVWEEALPVARWFEGPMSIRNRVFYLTTELLSERFKLEKLELPSSAFSSGT